MFFLFDWNRKRNQIPIAYCHKIITFHRASAIKLNTYRLYFCIVYGNLWDGKFLHVIKLVVHRYFVCIFNKINDQFERVCSCASIVVCDLLPI